MSRRLALIAGLLVAPALAMAQTTANVITVTESNDQDVIVNVAECTGAVTDLLSFTWNTTTPSLTGTFDLLASDQASCPTPVAGSTTTAHTITLQPALSTATTSLTSIISVTSVLAQLSIACPGPGTVVNFCLFASGTTSIAAVGSLTLDLQTPPAPVAIDVSPGDSSLTVSWTQGTGSADAGFVGAAFGYNVYCDVSPAPSPIARKCASVTGAGTADARIGGLSNGTLYDIEVTTVTKGGNESPHSNTLTGSPIEVNDFWRLYVKAGGRENGGCATGAAGLVAILALLPLAARRRRRRP